MGTIIVEDFDLGHTLESGQVFRFSKDSEYYFVLVGGKKFNIKQVGSKLAFNGVDRKFVNSFFRLNEDYKLILKSINKDEHLDNAIKEYYGLRLMKQDPWENIVSFICSSCANIPKIRINLNLLSEFFGEKLSNGYSFPVIGSLTDLEKLKEAKSGYRAKYLFEANKLVTQSFIEEVKSLDYQSAKEKIKSIPGIGDKVADCILLFSFGFDQAFPVDTWVQKALVEKYGQKGNMKSLQNFGQEYFGKYAGWAQQYLFQSTRLSQ